jgi:hypothetical protein
MGGLICAPAIVAASSSAKSAKFDLIIAFPFWGKDTLAFPSL